MPPPEPAPLRILHVAPCPFPTGQGTQRYIAGLAAAQAARGHRVTVLSYGHGGAAPPGVEVRRLPAVPGYRRTRSGPDLVRPLLDAGLAVAVRAVAADVVLAHGPEAALAAWAAGRPAIYVHHASWADELPAFGLGGLGRSAGRFVDRWAPRVADVVVALDAAGLRSLDLPGLAARGISAEVVPPGVDPDEFPDVHPRGGLVYAGNADAYQDLDLLAAALQRLPGVTLSVVPSSAGRYPFPARVHPVLPWPDAARLVGAAAAAVVPRRRCAGFPMKLLAYAGLGLPVAVLPGSARGVPGEVVAAGERPEDLADAITRALAMPRRDPASFRASWAWAHRAARFDALIHAARSRQLALYSSRSSRVPPWHASSPSRSSSPAPPTPR